MASVGSKMLSHWTYLCRRCCSTTTTTAGLNMTYRSPLFHARRKLSSKSSSSKSAVALQTVESPQQSQLTTEPPTGETSPASAPEKQQQLPPQEMIPYFSDKDIREMDEETRMKIHKVSSEIALAQSSSLINPRNVWRRKPILIMDESEWADSFVLKKRPPLMDRRGENETFWRKKEEDGNKSYMDQLIFIQQEIDLRPSTIRKSLARDKILHEIHTQQYNEKRQRILGNDLGAAHFIVVRKGKVKFLGMPDWISEYRKDAKPGLEEEDLPVMRMDLCTLPTKFDPRYRLEAIDASGLRIHFEGLKNLENLHHLKWLSLRESPFIDDWCLDRIARMYGETLEYLDLSGCPKVTDRGIGTLHRCRYLKTLVLDKLPHVENLEIVSAMLEDHNPDLEVVGIDYIAKAEQLRLEGEEATRKALEQKATGEIKLVSSTDIDSNSPKVLQLEQGTGPTMSSEPKT